MQPLRRGRLIVLRRSLADLCTGRLTSDEHFTADGTLIESWASWRAASARTAGIKRKWRRPKTMIRQSQLLTSMGRSAATTRIKARRIRRACCIGKPRGKEAKLDEGPCADGNRHGQVPTLALHNSSLIPRRSSPCGNSMSTCNCTSAPTPKRWARTRRPPESFRALVRMEVSPMRRVSRV